MNTPPTKNTVFDRIPSQPEQPGYLIVKTDKLSAFYFTDEVQEPDLEGSVGGCGGSIQHKATMDQ